jgi:asparagine synthase (glutamine-hydrolysing)
MSGFVALVNLDGEPVDQKLLRAMNDYQGFRGPDAARIEVIGGAGLGHTALRLDDASCALQPLSLGDDVWIVADARIDARSDLLGGLDATDAELILRAYGAWGENCVSHLLGDFAFAIWDATHRTLFCARDQLGVKPFFYSQRGNTIIVSNTLDCVRLHPAVSRDLDDGAIADFLLFGANQDPSATVFRDIRRLPPAHSMTWSAGKTHARRYWMMPVDEPLRFARTDDYSRRFQELLQAAVRDRLRTQRIGVLMSGGLDSPTLAWAAASLADERSSRSSLLAMTSVYDRLIPDRERHFAGLVAEHLNIPIRFDVRDDEISILDWNRVSVHTPEPVANPPASAAGVNFLRGAAADARVLLYGEGPDDAMRYEWWPYLRHLLNARRPLPILRAVSNDLLMHGRIPLWSSLRQALRRGERARWREEFPEWLNADFVRSADCRERWDARRNPPAPRHPLRPMGYRGLESVNWQVLFEDCDITGAQSGVEIRYPFLDLRLLRYMLAVPAMPWCRNKLLIRRAMRSALPAAVLRRRKTPLGASPDLARVRASGMPRLVPTRDLLRFVIPSKIRTTPETPLELRSALRPHGLNYWLDDLARN